MTCVLNADMQGKPPQKEIHEWKKDYFMRRVLLYDTFWAHRILLVHAPLSSGGCSPSTCTNVSTDAPALPQLTTLGQLAKERLGYYLHWKTLESTVRCMQLKHFLALSAQSYYMPDPGLQRHRGEVEEFRKLLCLFTTHCFIVLVFSCSPSSSWANSCHWQESLLLFFSRGYVYKITFNTLMLQWHMLHHARAWSLRWGKWSSILPPNTPLHIVQVAGNAFSQWATPSHLLLKPCPKCPPGCHSSQRTSVQLHGFHWGCTCRCVTPGGFTKPTQPPQGLFW